MYTVKLNIADIILALEFEDPAAAELVSTFYAGFLSDRAPTVKVLVRWQGGYEGWCPPLLPFGGKPHGRMVDGCYRVEWKHYTGSFHSELLTGSCSVQGVVGLVHFLWALMAFLLPRFNGALVHASSLSDGQCGYVFPAPSGTGKSTLVRNSPNHFVLSDEGSLIRLLGGNPYVYGSPFRSDIFRDYQFKRVALRGFYFLEQAACDCVLSLTKAEALERLIHQTYLSNDDADARRILFTTVTDMMDRSDAYLLQLKMGAGFWRCVSNGSYSVGG